MNIIINYKQCKSARDLLDWSQEELSQRAEVAKATIGDFERGVRNLRIETMQKVVAVLEDEGVRVLIGLNYVTIK
jgi:transcriptional regulator with XRE-family HTH domain